MKDAFDTPECRSCALSVPGRTHEVILPPPPLIYFISDSRRTS
jgi:hypothetical protein